MSYWICDKDQNCIDCPKHFPEETCEHWIEVELVKDIHTNADHIRAMTDEELADLFIMIGDGNTPEKTVINTRDMKFEQKMWLDWLKMGGEG